MTGDLYGEYAVLDAKIKALTDEKEGLRVKIVEDMVERGASKEETAVGSFTISKLKKWKYPEKVLAIKEKFEVAKAKAESSGEATFEEQDSLRFTAIKL